ncbi:UBX domain-containing protein 11 [Borealophlyctis nickersoniae]|nr:UBX domain-containing protein 11 [Borealophlyctis nickersoniae]
MRSVEELNRMAGEGIAVPSKSADGHTHLQTPTPLPLTIYQNGFILKHPASPSRTIFRPYSGPSAKLFMRDLMDGFYPYELKDTFPDGVPFDLHDRHTTVYRGSGKKVYRPFGGKGRTVGGSSSDGEDEDDDDDGSEFDGDSETYGKDSGAAAVGPGLWVADASIVRDKMVHHSPASQRPQTGPITIHTLNSNDGPLRAQTTTAFLSHLPKHVIRGGNILDVRAGIEELLVERPQEISQITLTLANAATPGTTLRIHAPNDTTREFIVRAASTHTIDDVCGIMQPHVEEMIGKGKEWEVRTALGGRYEGCQTLK